MSSPLYLGIFSGISYVSGLDYFKGINSKAMAITPRGLQMIPNPSIAMVSVDCDRYAHYLLNKSYDLAVEHILDGVRRLVAAGCNVLVIASNTAHIACPQIVQEYPELRVIHIADCCAYMIRNMGVTGDIGIVGTKPTMEEGFLKQQLAQHGLSTIIPSEQRQRNEIFRIIVEELSYNNFIESSKEIILSGIIELRDRGAKVCILACTEIELLLAGAVVEGIVLIPSAEAHISITALIMAGRLDSNVIVPHHKS